MKPICIDLFCGLGGWTEGFLAEGWDCIGFDIEWHDYGTGGYPGQLVIQDVLTVHGSQLKDANCIVASPPCQEYSYMAMPWSRGKKIAEEYRNGTRSVQELNALFDACFRIQREAIEAAGRYIPLIVENVRGAVPWVGPARWNYGSFYLWGDMPALMPSASRMKFMTEGFNSHDDPRRGPTSPGLNKEAAKGRLHGWSGGTWESDAIKHGGDCFSDPTLPGRQGGVTRSEARKGAGAGAGAAWFDSNLCVHGSRSQTRKAASAQIAKIPGILARHIARVYKPVTYDNI